MTSERFCSAVARLAEWLLFGGRASLALALLWLLPTIVRTLPVACSALAAAARQSSSEVAASGLQNLGYDTVVVFYSARVVPTLLLCAYSFCTAGAAQDGTPWWWLWEHDARLADAILVQLSLMRPQNAPDAPMSGRAALRHLLLLLEAYGFLFYCRLARPSLASPHEGVTQDLRMTAFWLWLLSFLNTGIPALAVLFTRAAHARRRGAPRQPIRAKGARAVDFNDLLFTELEKMAMKVTWLLEQVAGVLLPTRWSSPRVLAAQLLHALRDSGTWARRLVTAFVQSKFCKRTVFNLLAARLVPLVVRLSPWAFEATWDVELALVRGFYVVIVSDTVRAVVTGAFYIWEQRHVAWRPDASPPKELVELPDGGGNPFTILGLKRGATLKEAESAGRKVMLLYHPDKHRRVAPAAIAAAEQKFAAAKAAQRLLGSHDERNAYEAAIARFVMRQKLMAGADETARDYMDAMASWARLPRLVRALVSLCALVGYSRACCLLAVQLGLRLWCWLRAAETCSLVTLAERAWQAPGVAAGADAANAAAAHVLAAAPGALMVRQSSLMLFALGAFVFVHRRLMARRGITMLTPHMFIAVADETVRELILSMRSWARTWERMPRFVHALIALIALACCSLLVLLHAGETSFLQALAEFWGQLSPRALLLLAVFVLLEVERHFHAQSCPHLPAAADAHPPAVSHCGRRLQIIRLHTGCAGTFARLRR